MNSESLVGQNWSSIVGRLGGAAAGRDGQRDLFANDAFTLETGAALSLLARTFDLATAPKLTALAEWVSNEAAQLRARSGPVRYEGCIGCRRWLRSATGIERSETTAFATCRC